MVGKLPAELPRQAAAAAAKLLEWPESLQGRLSVCSDNGWKESSREGLSKLSPPPSPPPLSPSPPPTLAGSGLVRGWKNCKVEDRQPRGIQAPVRRQYSGQVRWLCCCQSCRPAAAGAAAVAAAAALLPLSAFVAPQPEPAGVPGENVTTVTKSAAAAFFSLPAGRSSRMSRRQACVGAFFNTCRRARQISAARQSIWPLAGTAHGYCPPRRSIWVAGPHAEHCGMFLCRAAQPAVGLETRISAADLGPAADLEQVEGCRPARGHQHCGFLAGAHGHAGKNLLLHLLPSWRHPTLGHPNT